MVNQAFSRALAIESLPDSLRSGSIEDLVVYARTVAYKVFHNIQSGVPMNPNADPLTVDGIPAPDAWPEHYATQKDVEGWDD